MPWPKSSFRETLSAPSEKGPWTDLHHGRVTFIYFSTKRTSEQLRIFEGSWLDNFLSSLPKYGSIKIWTQLYRLWWTLTLQFWQRIDKFNTFGLKRLRRELKSRPFCLTNKSWAGEINALGIVILLFGLVALEIKLVPKGYYIDANVSTGRRLLRVVFTLKQVIISAEMVTEHSHKRHHNLTNK